MTITITKIKYQYQSKYAHTFYVEFVVLKYKTQSAGFSSFFPTRFSLQCLLLPSLYLI